MQRIAVAIAFLLCLTGTALAQGTPLTVLVVPACGTGTSGYQPTQNRLATMDTTGKLCTSGSGGGGGGGNLPTKIIATGTIDVSTTDFAVYLWASDNPAPKSESIYVCNSLSSGNVVIVKDEFGTANTYPITLTPVTGTIDGVSTYVMNFAYQAAPLICDGAGNWSVAP